MSRSAPRLYLTGEWTARQQITLPPDRSHYLSAVLRAQPGMEVRLFNAGQGEWRAAVAATGRKLVTLEIVGPVRPPRPEPERCLIFAPIKRANLEWLVEKATELGVTRLLPVLTERTQVRSLNQARLHAIAIEAAEQCERLGVPVIAAPQDLPGLLAGWATQYPAATIHAALERSEHGEAQPLTGLAASKGGVETLLVGPEGGFSEAERALLQRQAFVTPVTLGPLILRAETAALAALSILALRD